MYSYNPYKATTTVKNKRAGPSLLGKLFYHRVAMREDVYLHVGFEINAIMHHCLITSVNEHPILFVILASNIGLRMLRPRLRPDTNLLKTLNQ
jgi:hypothetical protein